MAVGEWVQDPTNNKFFFRIRDQQTADLLVLAVQAKLGSGVDVKLRALS